MKSKGKLLLVLAPLALASCGIGISSTSSSSEKVTIDTSTTWGSEDDPSSSVSDPSTSVSVDSNVTSGSIANTSDYTGTISLKDDGTTVTGSNLAVSGNTITISAAGTYLVQGTLSNGNIYITADDDGEVELDLNGVGITRSGSAVNAPIYSVNGEKLKIKKMTDSVNVITDKRTSTVTNAEDNAAIFSNKKLEIIGSGSLTITSTFNNGIASDSKIEAKNGKLAISATNNAVKAHKSILLGDETDEGEFNISSTAGDALKVDEDETAKLDTGEFAGIKLIQGTFQISGKDDGIDSASNIYLKEGSGSIKATGTGSNSGSKGIVSALGTYITGGNYAITSASDDGIHSADLINISGGSVSISAGDDGIHADADLVISGGAVTVTKSYEGLEALNISITGGTNSITASDDGMNAAGGSDSSNGNDWGSTTSTTTPILTISGGYTYVAASGDGLDSNGNMIVSGGFTVVNQSGGGNGPLDYGDSSSNYFKQSGGFLAAYGTSDMAVGSSGTQYSFIATFSAVSTSNYMVVTNGSASFAIKPQFASAYSLYISDSSFTAGSVTLTSTSSISNGTEKYKGVYTGFTASSGSSLFSGTWSTSSVNLGSNTSSEHGPGGGGPGGGR